MKNSIIYWGPLIVASMVGHEHARTAGANALPLYLDAVSDEREVKTRPLVSQTRVERQI